MTETLSAARGSAGGARFDFGTYLRRNRLKFNIAHMNVQSINPARNYFKIMELKSTIKYNHSCIDVLGLTETWLKSHINNKSVEIPRYSIIRNDRRGRRAGGVAFYVKSNYKANVIFKSPDESAIEYLFVEIIVNSAVVLLGVIYRPEGNIHSLGNVISECYLRYENVFIMGDFNYYLNNEADKELMHGFWNSYNLHIVCDNTKPTHFDCFLNSLTLLDCFISNRQDFADKTQFWVPGISHHAFIALTININSCPAPLEFCFRYFKNTDVNRLLLDATNIDFTSFILLENPNDQLKFLTASIIKLYEKHVPIARFKIKDRQPPWLNEEIKTSMRLRNIAFKTYIANRNNLNWKSFIILRNKSNLKIRSIRIELF